MASYRPNIFAKIQTRSPQNDFADCVFIFQKRGSALAVPLFMSVAKFKNESYSFDL